MSRFLWKNPHFWLLKLQRLQFSVLLGTHTYTYGCRMLFSDWSSLVVQQGKPDEDSPHSRCTLQSVSVWLISCSSAFRTRLCTCLLFHCNLKPLFFQSLTFFFHQVNPLSLSLSLPLSVFHFPANFACRGGFYLSFTNPATRLIIVVVLKQVNHFISPVIII